MPAVKKWWFFRFHGLRISDVDIDPDNPMFGHCDLVSPQMLTSMIQQSSTDDVQLQRTLIGTIYHPFMPPTETFIVVSIMVPHGRNQKELEEEAFERARTFAALLSICRLATGSIPVSCGLGRDVNHNFYDSIRFDNPGWGIDFEQRGRITFNFPESAPTTRERLLNQIAQPEFAELAKLVLQPNSLPAGMHKSLTAALIRLASGIWSNEPETMLLGAFTTTEMLMGNGGHDRLKARTRILLGNELAATLKLDAVSQGRHDYVHKGKSVEIELGLTAIALAIATIVSYAKLAFSLDPDVCSTPLIEVLLDLSGQNPPVTAEHMAKLFRSQNIENFRAQGRTQFFQPVASDTITINLNTGADARRAAIIDMITRDYVNLSSAVSLQPDWEKFRSSHLYQAASEKFSEQEIEDGITRTQSLLEQQINFQVSGSSNGEPATISSS